MIVQNADGSINFAFNTDGSLQSITRDPDFVGPIATSGSGIAGNAFNDPTKTSGSWFQTAEQNFMDLGTSIYDLGVAGYTKVAANVSRLVSSSASAGRSLQSGIANMVQATPLGQVATQAASGTNSITSGVKAVGDFFQSTLSKIIIILIIAAVAAIFIMSFVQAKAGRLANA